MPARQVDPARLDGEALDRWYRRSPQVIEREREATKDAQQAASFGAGRSADRALWRNHPEDFSGQGPRPAHLPSSEPEKFGGLGLLLLFASSSLACDPILRVPKS